MASGKGGRLKIEKPFRKIKKCAACAPFGGGWVPTKSEVPSAAWTRCACQTAKIPANWTDPEELREREMMREG